MNHTQINTHDSEFEKLFPMKTLNLLAVTIFASCFAATASADLVMWQAQAASHLNNVTNSTNAGLGYDLTGGSGIDYDYGDLSNGSITTAGPGNSFEYIFDISDTGASIAIGAMTGWNNSESTSFRLEQWNNTGLFGVTNQGFADYTFAAASIFDTETHVVFVSRADGFMELYINGASQGTSSRGGNWVNNGGLGKLGASIGGGDAATGTILGVASYDSALTASDVSSLYNAYATAIPEPTSSAILGLAGLGLILNRRRKTS